MFEFLSRAVITCRHIMITGTQLQQKRGGMCMSSATFDPPTLTLPALHRQHANLVRRQRPGKVGDTFIIILINITLNVKGSTQ